MYKLFLFTALLLNVSCSKNSPNNPTSTSSTTILEYNVTFSKSDTYIIDYIDESGTLLTDVFTGTKWTKSFTIKQEQIPLTSMVKAGIQNNNTVSTATSSITVNKQLKAYKDFTLNNNSQTTSVTYLIKL